jgi:hypothetical protein
MDVTIVEFILIKDIETLCKEHLLLSDEIKKLRVSIDNNEKTEYDFIRYVPQRPAMDPEKEIRFKNVMKRKFRGAIKGFLKKVNDYKPI